MRHPGLDDDCFFFLCQCVCLIPERLIWIRLNWNQYYIRITTAGHEPNTDYHEFAINDQHSRTTEDHDVVWRELGLTPVVRYPDHNRVTKAYHRKAEKPLLTQHDLF